MHQDAHEFLNYLLNRIVEEIEASPEEDSECLLRDLSARTSWFVEWKTLLLL